MHLMSFDDIVIRLFTLSFISIYTIISNFVISTGKMTRLCITFVRVKRLIGINNNLIFHLFTFLKLIRV
jgi:hypothetical protein